LEEPSASILGSDGNSAEEDAVEAPKTVTTCGSRPAVRPKSAQTASSTAQKPCPIQIKLAMRQRTPFIEYENKAMRLSRERRWLQEDSLHLSERKEDLRRGIRLNKLAQVGSSTDDIYEKRTFYGSYSVKLRELAAQRRRSSKGGLQPAAAMHTAARRMPEKRPTSAPAGGRGRRTGRPKEPLCEDRSAVVNLRKLQKELTNSCSEETQRSFQDVGGCAPRLPLARALSSNTLAMHRGLHALLETQKERVRVAPEGGA